MVLTPLARVPAGFARNCLLGTMGLIGIAILLVTLGACAPKPRAKCQTAKFEVVTTSRGVYYILDAENMANLTAGMRGLAEGSCVVEIERTRRVPWAF